ncbi:MAG: DUF4595 domain-containing protein [Bacteroidaceae bacterium]|nr:DUF4595 domain-containing protein [Bacteroidaceae bacterium]
MANFKYLQKILFFLFMGVSMCALQACSDDDDDNGGGGGGTSSTTVGEVVPGSGKKLLSVGDYNFYYFTDGRVKYVEDYGIKHEFTYSPNQIITDYAHGEDYEDKEIYTVSYNSKGYISKMTFSESGSYDSDSWSDTGVYNLSYDGEGHLIKVTSTWTEQGVEDGESYKESGNGTVIYTWENGLLTKMESIELWADGTEKEIMIFSYEEGKNENKYKQYATFSDDYMCYLGLLGTGPDYLPVSIKCTYVEDYDDEEYSSSWDELYTYEFNEDGTLHRANNTYFVYGTIAEQNEIEGYQAKVTRAEKPRKKGDMFGLRSKNRR